MRIDFRRHIILTVLNGLRHRVGKGLGMTISIDLASYNVVESNYDFLHETVNKYCLAVKTQDKDLVYSIFSKNNKCMLISVGKVFEGLDSIFQDFLGLIKQLYSKIELIKDEDLKINFIDEKTAIVIFKYHTECILRENGKDFGINGVETQLIIKEDGNWKIVHIHYSKN